MADPDDDPFGAAARLEGVPSALAAARDGVDVLLRDRGMRRTSPALTSESLLVGAVASAQLAGSAATLEEVRAGGGDETSDGALRLYAGLLRLAPVVARSPLQALARMHALAAAGSAPDEELGRPRSDPDAAAVLRELAALLLAPTTAPAIAVAALAHARVITHQPFGYGNGLVARALERLLLVSRGVDPVSVTVPEAGHLVLQSGYREALTGYESGGPVGKRGWLLHAAAAVTEGVAASPLRETDSG